MINKDVMSQVFVSYKRVDKDKVFPIVHKMESELGIKFWVDLEGIDGDSQFTSVIIDAIIKCEVFLFMYSMAHEKITDTENDYTVRELCFAHELRKRIVFIEIEVANLPYWFKFNFPQRQVTQANDNRSMNKLISDIRKWLRLPQTDKIPNKQGLSTFTKDVQSERDSIKIPKFFKSSNSNPQAIDLGLTSGTRWASCNVGATKPEEYGGYYAWGETEEKKIYDEKKYAHIVGFLKKSYRGLGNDIAGSQYDVAYKKWGDIWQIPTFNQIKELLENCTTEWIKFNGVLGRMFTSKINGNSIFLPAAGYHSDNYLFYAGTYGNYWSSTQGQSGSDRALSFRFRSDSSYIRSNGRSYGLSVRPVIRY